MTTQQVEITVWNRQGASDVHTGTRQECESWFANVWSDPDNMRYEIRHEGNLVSEKAFGEQE